MRVLRLLLLLGLAMTSPAWALVTIGADPEGSIYRMAPENGAPWRYVAQIGSPGAYGGSAVYLGNSYLVTAEHVNLGPVLLNGRVYQLDQSYAPHVVGANQLKVIR